MQKIASDCFEIFKGFSWVEDMVLLPISYFLVLLKNTLF